MLKTFLKWIVQHLFPRHCPICKEITVGSDAAQLCADCAMVFEADLLLRCPVCRLAASECICTPGRLKRFTDKIDGHRVFTTAFYQPGDRSSYVNKLIYALKNDPEDTAARIFAQMMSHEILLRFTKSGKDIREWIITYPPRREEKVDDIGFDQAERLAQMCAEYTGARFAILLARYGGKEQKSLNRAEREANMKNAFYLKKPRSLQGARVILCDDVLTTGATLTACASLLKEAGVKEIVIVTAAKTVRREKAEQVVSDISWFTDN